MLFFKLQGVYGCLLVRTEEATRELARFFGK